jgi:hypothetical protein
MNGPFVRDYYRKIKKNITKNGINKKKRTTAILQASWV